jgi:hypothetical protein
MNASQERLRFDHVQITNQQQGSCEVKVALALGGRVIEASAAGDSDGVGPLKAAVSAALRAVETAVEGRFACRLVDLDHVNALGRDLIAVLVDVSFEGKQMQLFGSCRVQASEIDTAVKAALNATNRVFELAMRG